MTNEILRRIEELEKRVERLESKETNKVTISSGIREFFEKKDPASHVEKTLVIAYYLEATEGEETVTVEDISEAYRKLREPAPKNINDQFYKAVKRKYMIEAESVKGNKSWMLSSTGIKTVEEMNNE